MRLFVSALLCFAVTFSTIPVTAQNATAPRSSVSPTRRSPSQVVVLYECDNGQCEDPNWGGALWVFDGLYPGAHGQSVWRYYCIANLTITAYDGKNLTVERDDPPGSKATHAMPTEDRGPLKGHFTGQYSGSFSGKRIMGQMAWNHGAPGTNRWHATRIDLSSECDTAQNCPLTADQMAMLGGRLLDAGMTQQAEAVLQVASDNLGSPEAEGVLAIIGYKTKSMTPQQIFSRAQRSSDSGSWSGKLMLSTCYSDGIGTSINPKMAEALKRDAQRLQPIADQRDQETERREIALADAQCASWNCKGRVNRIGEPDPVSAILMWGFLAGVFGGGDGPTLNVNIHLQ